MRADGDLPSRLLPLGRLDGHGNRQRMPGVERLDGVGGLAEPAQPLSPPGWPPYPRHRLDMDDRHPSECDPRRRAKVRTKSCRCDRGSPFDQLHQSRRIRSFGQAGEGSGVRPDVPSLILKLPSCTATRRWPDGLPGRSAQSMDCRRFSGFEATGPPLSMQSRPS
jgi:hypothetical protein